jgi:hypothetical protein
VEPERSVFLKTVFVFVVLICLSTALFAQGNAIYASPAGVASNSGASPSSPIDFPSAVNKAVAGDTILLEPGTYAIAFVEGRRNTIVFAASGAESAPIRVIASGAGATFDFSFPEKTWVQDSVGFAVSGSWWRFSNIGVTRAGYQGVYVTGGHNVFENCRFFDNRNTGMEINKGGHHTLVINCDAYRNFDPKKNGSMADGFGPKQTQGGGNRFVGCRSWENSDDGYDCYDSPEVVVFENCWAFRNGVDVWHYGTFEGNGNGFKSGGNYKLANIRLVGCVAFGHPQKGFDQNNNTGGLVIWNCTAFANGLNYGLQGRLAAGQTHDLANNISVGGPVLIKNANERHNSWNEGYAATEADFVSLDLSLAAAPRSADGSLPETPLFRITAASGLVDRGVDLGLAFKGAASDLGAFEKK